MTMKPGDPAVRLYACEDDPKAPWCNRPVGKRCITQSGKETSPHPKRWALGRGYADAVNELQPQINQLKAQNTDLGRRVTEAAEDLAGAQHDLSAVAAEKLQLAQQLLAEQHAHQVDADKLEAALARIDELTKPEPEPNPVPPMQFLVGGCPPSPGGGKTADGQRVIDVLGKGATDRQFLKFVAGSVAPRPTDAGRVTVSFSQDSDTSIRNTSAQMAAAVKPLKDLCDLVAWYHEFDSKVRGGKYTLPEVTAALEHNLQVLAEVRPDLWTCAVLTGWLFSPAKGAPGKTARDAYGPIAAKHRFLAVDLDGIHSWPYTDYLGHIPNILAFMDQFGIEQFVVSELGWSKLGTKKGDVFTPHTKDPDGAIRIEKYAELLEALKATGRCLGADLFLYDTTPGYNLTSPAEISRARELVTSLR